MNKRIIVYTGVEVFILLMAWLTFGNLGDILQFGSENLSGAWVEAVNRLYVLQAILIFPLFLLFLGLIVQEIMLDKKTKEQKALLAQEELLNMQVEEIEDTEELNKEKERIAQEQAQQREQKLFACVDTILLEKSVENQKKNSEKILSCIAGVYEITQAEIFVRQKEESNDRLVLSASYAFYIPEEKVFEFQMGEGLIGQVAKAGKFLYLDELPQGYVTVKSGLGSATPNHLLIVPWKNKENEVVAVVELASFKDFTIHDIQIIEKLADKVVDFYA